MMPRKISAYLCPCFKQISSILSSEMASTSHPTFKSLGFYFTLLTFFLASYATPTKGLSTTKTKPSDVSNSLYSVSADISDETQENSQMGNIEVPRVQELRRKRRKNKRRSKKNKKCKDTFCFNNGACHWIKELKQATCRCQSGFNGERCQFLVVEFTGKQKERDTTIAIAVVVSAFVLIGILTAACICWRRFKNVRDHLEVTTFEVEEKNGMMVEHEINQNNVKKCHPNDDRESVV